MNSQLPPGTYHCLSVWQPWAWAIFNGKPIENRTWPVRYRGKLLIHASKSTRDVEEVRRLLALEFQLHVPLEQLVFGAIIGIVDLYDCRWSETRSACGWGAPNAYHWHLRDQHLLDQPVPCRGAQGIFTFSIAAPAQTLNHPKQIELL